MGFTHDHRQLLCLTSGLISLTERIRHSSHVFFCISEKKEIVVDKGSNVEKWKTVKGFCGASCKENGRSGCGVVILGVDKEKWVTISKIALPLRECTDMAVEMTGVCLLMGVLNLILNKNLNVGNVNRCIGKVLDAR